ncbi:MAG: hypothetical protein Ct9H300mP29_1450 [Candidatus Neomarinimicrobiota bacterium]|nr:MAG: hypothetical protein Ct9H300mP29_1450 [Candidatus Neomarinimicrobiota bacterium]
MELEGAVGFMNAYLGWIKGTSLRKNAYGEKGGKKLVGRVTNTIIIQ